MRGVLGGFFGRAVGCALSFCLVTGPVFASAPQRAFAQEPTALTTGESTSLTPSAVEASPTVVREDITKRTENSKHLLLSDGTYRAQVGSGPLHYRKDGKWTDIDPRLAPGGESGEFSSVGLPATVTVGPQQADSGPVVLSGEDWSVGIDMLGTSEVAKIVMGDRATYLDVAPETDLTYEALPGGIKETLTLASADAPTQFSFRLDLEGLSAVSDFTGGVALQRADGSPSGLSLSRLLVTDSSSDAQGRAAVCEDATMSVESVPGGLAVSYSIPEAWMHDPARVFPVQVDPTITTDTATYVDQYTPGVSYGTTTRMNVGKLTTGYQNTYAKWDLADANLPANANILSADASLWLVYAYTGATEKLGRVTSTWSESSTYSTRPTTTLLTTQYVSGSNKWVAWAVDDTVRDWFYGRATNYGLSFSQDYTTGSRHEYASDEESYAAHRPTLTIDYEVPTDSVSGQATSYKVGDTITTTVRVNTAAPSSVREVRLLPNMTGDASRWRGYFGWFAYDPGSTWNSVAAPGGGYFGYLGSSTYGGDKVTELISQWSVSSGTTYKDVTFKWTIEDDYGDIQDNDLDTYFQTGTASAADGTYGWTNHDTNFDVLPKPVSTASASTTASAWFTEVDRDTDGKPDNANDGNGKGRGDVALSWSASPLADGYRIYLYDGGEYRKVGETIGNLSTDWSSAGAGIFPADTEIAAKSADSWSGDPFYRSAAPSAATRDAAGTVGVPGESAGLVVTDGSFLYTRAYSQSKVISQWKKVGTGLAGTTKGQVYDTIGVDLSGRAAGSAIYYDGFIYNGYAVAPNAIEGVSKSAQDGESAVSTLTLAGPMLDHSTGLPLTAASSSAMLASDGETIFSVAEQDDKDETHLKVRVFERNATTYVDHLVSCPTQGIDGVFADGANLYLLDGGTSGSKMTRVSTATWKVTGCWDPGVGTTHEAGGTYDPANNVFWIGSTDSGHVYRHAGPGLDLRDSANALYGATDGESYDARADYAWRVVPYSELGDLSVWDNNLVSAALADRTVGVNDEPRHTEYDLGQMAGMGASAQIDEGDLSLSSVDLSIDSYGPGAGLMRTYDSGETTGTFAPGWRFGYQESIEVTGSLATYIDGSGEEHRFVLEGGVWHSPLGFRGTLAADGSAYEITFKDRSVRRFESGLLVSDTDRNGNATTYDRSEAGHILITAANSHVIDVETSGTAPVRATYAAPGAAAAREVLYSRPDSSTAEVTYYPGKPEGYTLRYTYGIDSRISQVRVLDDDGSAEYFAGTEAVWDFEYDSVSGDLSTATFPAHAASSRSTLSFDYSAPAASGETTVALSRTAVSVGEDDDATVTEWKVMNPTGTLARSYDPTVTTSPGAGWTYSYTPDGEAFEEISPTGKKLSRTYDNRGNVIYDFDELGHRNAFVYDSSDQLIRSTDPLGATTYQTYDSSGNLTAEERQLNANERSRTEYTYDAAGRTTQERRRISATEWAVTRYDAFADNGAPETTCQDGVKLSSSESAQTITTTSDHDAWGNAIAQTDGLGTTTTQSQFGELGLRLYESQDASRVVSHTRYDLLGNQVESWRSAPGTSVKADWRESIVDPAGRTRTEITYLHDGVTASTQTTVTHAFDGLGRELSSDDALSGGLPSETRYDARGNVIAQWSEGLDSHIAANASISSYDAYGQLSSSLAPGTTVPTMYDYNADGTTSRVDNPDGTYATYVYDDAGNQVSSTTQDGTTTTQYDLGGRTVASTSADDVTTTSTFDLLSRQISVTGAGNQNASTTTYNELGQVLSSVDADGIESSSAYDAAGRVTANTVVGKTMRTVFDSAGHTLSTTDPDGAVVGSRFDEFGRTREEVHTTAAGDVRHTDTTYDSLGRATATDDGLTGVHREFTFAAAPGQSTTLVTRYADVTTTTTVNASGVETSRVTAFDGTAMLTRSVTGTDDVKRETGWTVGSSGFASTFANEDGKLASTSIDTAVLEYGYDASSGRKIADTGTLPLAGSVAAAYTFTPTGRLASDTTSGSATYAFDAAGNIATETVGALQRIYQYGAGNRLENTEAGGSVETTFTFNAANGWRTAQGPVSNPTERVFDYTGTGRLASYATSQGVSATYGYDAAGQRISSEVIEPSADGTVTTQTRYIYEGLSLLSLASTRTVEGTSAVDVWEISYLYDGQGRPYAGVYRSGQDSVVPFVMVTTDRGDVVELRDTSGSPFVAYGYDAWGMHRSDVCTSVAAGSVDAVTAAEISERQPLRYAGYCFDAHSGLYHLSARTYDPATRQFLSKDPAKADGEESAYQYCGGDPVGDVDPSGLWATVFEPRPLLENTDVVSEMMIVNAGYARQRVIAIRQAMSSQSFGRSVRAQLAWFIGSVTGGSPWDLKFAVEPKHQDDKVFKLLGGWYSLEDLGNMHFGYLCAALSIPYQVVSIGGAAYAGKTHWKDTKDLDFTWLRREAADQPYVAVGYYLLYPAWGYRYVAAKASSPNYYWHGGRRKPWW